MWAHLSGSWLMQKASLSYVVQLFMFLLFTKIIVINPVGPFCSHVCVFLCIKLMKTFLASIQLVWDSHHFSILLLQTFWATPWGSRWNGQHPWCDPPSRRSHLCSPQVHLVHEVRVLPETLCVRPQRDRGGAWGRSKEERRCCGLWFDCFGEYSCRHVAICPGLHLHWLLWAASSRGQAQSPSGPDGANQGGETQTNLSIFLLSLCRLYALKDCVYLIETMFTICFDQESNEERLISSLQDLNVRGRSALEVYRSLPTAAKEDVKVKSRNAKPGKKAKGGKGDKAEANEGGANPVKTLQAVAKKLGLGSLSARWERPPIISPGLRLMSFHINPTLLFGRLDGVKYENGKINVVNRKSGNKPKFYQKKWYVEKQMWTAGARTKRTFLMSLVLRLCSSYLHDVTLKSEDGKEFPCHKSVLCARLGKSSTCWHKSIYTH